MAERVDENGAAYAGSQLQTQLWVNRRPGELAERIRGKLSEIGDAGFEWRSPLADERYEEYRDDAFLAKVGHPELGGELRGFWPRGGPVWDGLAVLRLEDGSDGVLLVEGKSYPGELYGRGCKATPASRAQIEEALAWTQERLGIEGRTAADWCGPLYQNANRLAHVYWLRSREVKAWFVHLLFSGDPHSPTSEAEWEAALAQADAELGIDGVDVEYAAHVILPAGKRGDLVPPLN